MSEDNAAADYRVLGPRGTIYELSTNEAEKRIKSGFVKPSTLVAFAGTEEFARASSYEALAIHFPSLDTVGRSPAVAPAFFHSRG